MDVSGIEDMTDHLRTTELIWHQHNASLILRHLTDVAGNSEQDNVKPYQKRTKHVLERTNVKQSKPH